MGNQLPTGNSASMLSALPQLLELFVGSGKNTKGGTTTQSQTTNPNSNPTAVNALVSLLQSDAANPNAAGSVVSKAVQNSIQQMMLAGVPSIGAAERGSGIFNSSATSSAMNNLEATAAAKAAELEVNQMNTAAKTQGETATALNAMTAAPTVTATTSESTTSKTAGVIDPLYAGLGLAGAMGLSYLLKGKSGNGSSGSNIAGSNLDLTPAIKPDSNADLLNVAFDGLGGKTATQFLGSTADSIASGLKDSLSGSTTGTGGWEDFTNVLSGVGTNLGISTAINAISGLFGGGSSSSSSGSGSSGGTVICTRMYELGYLSDETYSIDKLYGAYLQLHNPDLVHWYHSWAIPFVTNWLHGRTWVSRVTIKAMILPVRVWSSYMKWQMGKLIVEALHGHN